MSVCRTVARALSMVGQPARYRLGAGGRKPEADSPLDPDLRCDCSGFALWCLGWRRFREAPDKTITWIDTTRLWRDATTTRAFVAAVDGLAVPGDLVVYPDRKGSQGHVGIVLAVDGNGRPDLIAHCSRGNDRMHPGFAIQATGAFVFFRHADCIVCRPVG